MIPQGRPAMTEDDIAAVTGLPVHTWHRRHGAAFRARPPWPTPANASASTTRSRPTPS